MKLQKHYSQLDYQERQTIAIAREQGLSILAIARILNRAACTSSREIGRNGGGATYSCYFAQQRHKRERRHSRAGPKLVAGNALFESVRVFLQLRWSPQQMPHTWLN